MKPIRPHVQKRIATGLMILFLALALVPIYQILAKFAPSGRFVQLCSSMGIQTVWVTDETMAESPLPLLKASSMVQNAEHSSVSPANPISLNLSSPFGSCEFCWTSVLATVLPLAWVLFFGLPEAQFSTPVYQPQAVQSFLRQWHARPRAPPFAL